MGQKVHPYGIRLGIIRTWLSKWFAEDARYRDQLIEDVKMRKLIQDRLRNAAVSQITIERTADAVTVIIRTAKPGVVIGRSGSGVDRLNREIQRQIGRKVHLTVEEVKRPEVDAQLVADNIAHQIERRISFRRAMSQSIQRTMRAGAEGVKVKVSGRLGGAEIAHSETDKSRTGRVPLHTFRADIDYGLAEARTNQGNIGVKVWIYKGDIMPERKRRDFEEARERAETPGMTGPRRETPGEEAETPEAAAPEEVAPEAGALEAAAPGEAAQPEPAPEPEAAAPAPEVEAEPAEPGAAAPVPEVEAEPAEPEAAAPAPEAEAAPEPEPPADAETPEEGEQTDADA